MHWILLIAGALMTLPGAINPALQWPTYRKSETVQDRSLLTKLTALLLFGLTCGFFTVGVSGLLG